MNISHFANRGFKWSSISQISRQSLNYTTTLILASLILPSEFGLMAMALVVIGFLEILKDLGTASAIIHKDKFSEDFISSIYWVNVLFGILLTTSIFFSAPVFVSFFDNRNIEPILKVLSINFVISTNGIVPKAILEKKLYFDKLSKVEIISTFSGSITGIILAVSNFGVWSLVFQSLVTTSVQTIFLWVIGKWYPRFIFNYSKIKSIIGYSLNLIGYNFFNYIARNLDYILIGKFLGDNELGHYYIAYKIMLYPVQNISVVISRVTFPIFSKLKNDDKSFIEIFIYSIRLIAFFTFPLMLGMIVLSNYFTAIFFSNWNTELLTILLIILSPVGLTQSICSITGPIYQAKGRTDWLLKWGIFTSIGVIIAFSIGLNWGVIGVASSYLIITSIWTYPCFAIPFKLINMKFFLLLKSLNRIFIISLIMSVLVFILSRFIIASSSNLVIFLTSIILGVIFYLFWNKIFNKNQLRVILDLIKS